MAHPNIDVLLLTALTEEQQVVHAVLRRCARWFGEHGDIPDQVALYNLAIDGDASYLIATACMHDMGAVAMSSFTNSLLATGLRPAAVALLGIAASVKHDELSVGDVPVASAVFSANDIKVHDGIFQFRTQGYQVDHRMKVAAGVIREDGNKHQKWRSECRTVIEHVVAALNEDGLRHPPSPRHRWCRRVESCWSSEQADHSCLRMRISVSR